MKKTPIVAGSIVLALLAALLLPPFWLGTQAEQVFTDRLTVMATQNGLQLKRNHFERGWFTSQADTVLQVPGVPIEISARHTIYHGPLALGRWLQGTIDTGLKQAQIETRGEIKLTDATAAASAGFVFTMDTTIGLDGSGHSLFESPALTRTIQAGKVDWRGLQGDIQFDATTHHIRTNLRAPGLTFGSVEITDMHLRSDLHEGVAGHHLGKSTFEVARLSFAPLVRVKGLKMSADTTAHGDTLTIGVVYEAPEIQVSEQQYGPARLALEFRKLDALVLAKFQEEIRALQSSDRPAEQSAMMQMGKMLQLIGELAKRAPELEINELSFRSGGEELRAKAKLVLDGSNANIAENPLLMLTAVVADAELSLPATFVKPMLLPLLQADLEDYRRRGVLKKGEADKLTPQQMTAILDRSLPMYLARNDFTRRLVADGNRFRLNASLRRGQVLVNGEPMNIPGAGMMPSLPR